MRPLSKKLIKQIPLQIAILIIMSLCIFPTLWMILRSVQSENIQTNSISLDNYSYIFKKLPVGKYLFNSFIVCLLCVIGTLISCTLGAYGFSRIKWKYRDAIFSILLAGLAFPSIITIIPIFIGWSKFGMIGSYAPLIIPSWFGGSTLALYLIRQYFIKLPSALDDAAKIDGANHMQILTKIILPLSRPVIIATAAIAFLIKWSEFTEPLIYLDNQRNYTLALGLQVFNSGNLTRWNILMAACTLCAIPVLVIYLCLVRFISRNDTKLFL